MNYEKFNSLSLSLSLSLLKNKIKQKKEKAIILLLFVLISVLFVSTITYGATTIGSSIDTGGNLTVSGNATLGDNATDLIKSIGSFYASSTLQATGAARFYSTARIDGATVLNSVSYTWPSSDGSASTYLQTNGAGTLSWATVSSGANSDWLKQTNFGILNLTASTTIPYWAKDAIYASSTLQVQGLTTLANASTTQLTNSGLSWFNNLATFTTASTTGSVTIGDASEDILTINAGTIQYLNSATTTIPQSINAWSIATSTTATPIFTIDGSNGNVGIGTIAPAAPLHIYSTNTGDTSPSLIIQRADNTGNKTKLQNYYSGLSYLSQNMYRNTNGTWNLGDTGSAGVAMIESSNSGIESPRISFLSLPVAQNGTENLTSIMTLLNTGNVGIGETAPGSKLSVSGGATIGASYDTVVAPSNGMLIESKVGIGTTTPTTMFQVATSTANATTTIEVGKANQNKGTCLKLYDDVGAVYYCRITGGTFTCNTTSCE